ncbi:calponin homology domain-containing protein DDB_G0272472-like isoform X1 [Acropora millepora]|uniref:calponin homology domain-containing protein DDB_G0272472-like isoform X1 n=1 Tax=Acropora millepora TaxID=45264 RepID=UPI001CF1AB0A|nr:calponin homology domain-containing protein DDB_G0272472-like isoform X1 [Acropora millepora]
MDRILTKYKEEDMKGLKRSGTEEEFTEIQQLCEDILVYRRDMIEIRKIEKESRMKKDQEDKRKGEEMRQAAVERLAKRRSDAGTSGGATCDVSCSGSDEETPSKGIKRKVARSSRKSAIEMLSEKYKEKAKLKEKELEVRKMELDLQKQKYEDEAEERKLLFSMLREQLKK